MSTNEQQSMKQEQQEKRYVRIYKNADDVHWKAVYVDEKPESGNELYNRYQIPPNWDQAKVHREARRVSREIKSSEQIQSAVCQCCGYEINRKDIDICSDFDQFGFLGSGFPMFYNFFQYSIFMLFQFFMISGGFNLVTNLMGSKCKSQEFLNAKHLQSTHVQNNSTLQSACISNWAHITSMANQNNPDLIVYQSALKLVNVSILMFTLMFFRRSQRQLNITVDEKTTSPADYTIMIKNIPKNLAINYYEELRNILQNYSVPGEQLQVTKIVLVYELEEVFVIENQIKSRISEIQQHLSKNRMNFEDPDIVQLYKEIDELEEKNNEIIHDILNKNDKFVGQALVSFQTEKQKSQILFFNQFTLKERLKTFFYDGQNLIVNKKDLVWENQKLFCEQAPEPNEINWEFLHLLANHTFHQKRILMNFYAILFMALTFLCIFFLSYGQAKLQAKEGTANTTFKIISVIINMSIVFVNKFIIGWVFHLICDGEQISTLTRFNISLAIKLAIALFFNTAIMSFIIDIIMFRNVLGSEGFIYNETMLFILNSLFPPFVWLIDPWIIIQKFLYQKELLKGNKSVLTQEQANQLAERPAYSQAKRYADLIKTLWTTYLYGSVLPLGILYSLMGLSVYYFIDKWNLVTRRTVKEALGKQLSMVMTDFLDFSIFLLCLGDFIFKYIIEAKGNWIDYLTLFMAVIYTCSPKERINELLFPIMNVDEPMIYDEAEKDFDTDYDRENPLTRKAALKQWRK